MEDGLAWVAAMADADAVTTAVKATSREPVAKRDMPRNLPDRIAVVNDGGLRFHGHPLEFLDPPQPSVKLVPTGENPAHWTPLSSRLLSSEPGHGIEHEVAGEQSRRGSETFKLPQPTGDMVPTGEN